MWGIDRWGIWLLGVIAVIWTIDCFTGFYLTLPPKKRTRVSDEDDGNVQPSVSRRGGNAGSPHGAVRWTAGVTKLNFDLHRAFSLWTWGLLFIVAFTAFSLNSVFRSVLSVDVEGIAGDAVAVRLRPPNDKHNPIEPTLSYSQVFVDARKIANERGWSEPTGSAFYVPEWGIYGVEFYYPSDGHGAGGVGHRRLYFDGRDGQLLGDFQPWRGTAADLFVQAQFPLHSGRILGLPGRIMISALGLVVAMLSVTGVIIWLKKRSARVRSSQRASEYVSGLKSEASILVPASLPVMHR